MKRVSLPSDLRGASRIAVDATLLLTELVETMHHNIIRRPSVLGRATFQPTRGVTGFVYRSIRGVTRLVGGSIDTVLAQLVPLLGTGGGHWPGRETVLAALNGVLGDYLVSSHNPLAIEMHLRHGGQPLVPEKDALASAFPDATGKLVLLVHGLCMNDLRWDRQGHDHGRALARDLGYTPLYLHYNSGLHVSVNGRALADLLETLVAQWPVPVEEVAIIGHSMGGLVARSAAHYAHESAHRWPQSLRQIVFLGTPHHGAPLERGGHWLDIIMGSSPYTAAFTRLGRVRSAGITDMRHGNLIDEDWSGHDRFVVTADPRRALPLPEGVGCFAIAASATKAPNELGKRLLGDGLVPVNSALGRHDDPDRALAIPAERQWVGYGLGHLELLSSRDVYRQIRRWLGEGQGERAERPGGA